MLTDPIGLSSRQYPRSSESTAARSKLDQGMGKEDFLTLLVTQLRHQDPLNPVDSVQFTSQLAQFSSLEQLFGVNDSLAGIQNSLSSRDQGNVLDYIGKSVRTNDSTIAVKNGETDAGVYVLDARADVTAFILDPRGREVRQIRCGWQDAGEQKLEWDGRDNDGLAAGDGVYAFEVVALDKNGQDAAREASFTGKVTGVTYERGEPYLMVGNRLITPDRIVEVKEPSNL